jgi:hypothetical protein
LGLRMNPPRSATVSHGQPHWYCGLGWRHLQSPGFDSRFCRIAKGDAFSERGTLPGWVLHSMSYLRSVGIARLIRLEIGVGTPRLFYSRLKRLKVQKSPRKQHMPWNSPVGFRSVHCERDSRVATGELNDRRRPRKPGRADVAPAESLGEPCGREGYVGRSGKKSQRF